MRKNLKMFRVQNDLSHETISQKIGCSRATYSAIERGIREGRRAFWEDLQIAFKLSDDKMWALMKNERP